MINNCMMSKECEDFKLFGKSIYPRKGIQDNKPLVATESDSKQEDPIIAQSTSRKSNKGTAYVEGEEEVGSNHKDDEAEGKDGGKAALKKPDKLLPCPRCESMDTKFCYYNNYNVNQPRHFCKNCQRYWTAGGSLRNVPVGAGRRKNKHSFLSPHYRQIRSASASEMSAVGLRTKDLDSSMKMIPSPLKIQIDVSDSGPTVLNFGHDSCRKTIPGGGDSQRMEQQQSRDEISCGSSVTAEGEATGHMRNQHTDCLKWPNGVVAGASPAPFFTGPCSYGWDVNVSAPGPWAPMPWPLVPGSHFGAWATGPWVPAPWAVAAAPAPAPMNTNTKSDRGPRTLGKRPQPQGAGTVEGGLYVPKTLRIEDPREAARSSIWATLGLGNKSESTALKAFQPKTEGGFEAASHALRANPAAFSRSISFQESN